MRRIRGNPRALSEIVGTLFLVLIVVAAATSFSVFLAQYQKQAQANQAMAHNRSLESLRVLHVIPELNGTTKNTWVSVNFTIGSSDVNPSTITTVALNDLRTKQFVVWAQNTSTGTITSTTVLTGGFYTLTPSEDVAINLTFTGVGGSFFSPYVIATTSYVKLDLFTALLNDFSSAFIPPSAIALVAPLEKWTGTGFVVVPELDGSNSFQSGNGTIIQWAWNVTPWQGNQNLIGERAVLNLTAPFHTWNITLVVKNNDGLLGSDLVHYP
ncbi:MAG TPA: archaellin/type IV pilin N-terminal domain-containing protein [Thermoplasmata archaeon]|nr:archaellin/type IV pilin N-terminal domain-containing protein [Thermoplasmata archaeon]